MNAPVREALWDTSCTDWRERIMEGRSLIPALPLNEAVAAKALRIFKRLVVPDLFGRPTYGEVCGEWVFDLVAAVFGSYNPETKRRALREIFLLVPKKNGKSSIAAAIMVTAIIVNARPEAEGLLIAPTKEIAAIAFRQAEGIIAHTPGLAKHFIVQRHLKQITHRHTAATLAIKAADQDTITGSKATYILIDETHVFAASAKASQVFVEVRGSLAARPDGFLLQITTQSKTPPSGVFKAELDVARAVRDGTMALPLLPVLYELPLEETINDRWRRPEVWGLVNPNLNRSVDLAYLQDELLKADRVGPEQLALFASQHFNVQIGLGLAADKWPGALFWEAAGEDEPFDLEELLDRSEVVTAGIDGGGLDDLAALAVIGREIDTGRWLLWGRAWAQPQVLELRKEIVPRLQDFAADGDLVFCTEPRQDADEMADICERIWKRGLLPPKDGIGVDAFGTRLAFEEILRRGIPPEAVVAVRQGVGLQDAIKTMPRQLRDRTLVHARQPLMAWAVGNAKQELKGSNYMVTKQAAGAAKIDPVMASFNAAILMGRAPAAAFVMTPWDRDPEYRLRM